MRPVPRRAFVSDFKRMSFGELAPAPPAPRVHARNLRTRRCIRTRAHIRHTQYSHTYGKHSARRAQHDARHGTAHVCTHTCTEYLLRARLFHSFTRCSSVAPGTAQMAYRPPSAIPPLERDEAQRHWRRLERADRSSEHRSPVPPHLRYSRAVRCRARPSRAAAPTERRSTARHLSLLPDRALLDSTPTAAARNVTRDRRGWRCSSFARAFRVVPAQL
jgi:hypothetical protein